MEGRGDAEGAGANGGGETAQPISQEGEGRPNHGGWEADAVRREVWHQA